MRVYSQASSMHWDNLKFFLALAETGSLSRASGKLRVDHSTVARRIEMLEQDLGVRRALIGPDQIFLAPIRRSLGEQLK
jgi:DNA-binding transcriptional LysR family regulator